MYEKTDLRVLRTRKMILAAFTKLLATKNYESITIQEIADEAMINRGTFYAHYQDKLDLYEHILTYTVETFTTILDTEQLITNNSLKLKQVQRTLTHLFQQIKAQQQLFTTMTAGSSGLLLRDKLTELLQVKYAKTFEKLKITENENEVPIAFIVEYMSAIFMSTVQWWIKTDCEFEADKLARLLIKLVGNGHLTVLGIEVED